MYDLHNVIIKKPISINDAKQLAKHFITDKNKRFYRETETSYRFRNISKTKFIKSSFRTKKINPSVTLTYGELIV
jgi:hypothetical protein